MKFFLQKSSSKRSSVDIKCSFDNPGSNFSAKSQKVFAQSKRTMEIFVLEKLLFLRMFLWTTRLKFWKACQKFFPKSWIIFSSYSRKTMKRSVFFFRKTIIETFQWRRKLQCWQTCRKLSPKVRNFSAQLLRTKKTWVSFQKKARQNFHLVTKNAVWTTLRKFFSKHLKFFNSEVTKMNEKTTFTEKKFLLKLFARTREMQFGHPCWNIFSKILEKIGWNSKTISKDIYIFFFQKSRFFFKMFSWTPRLHFWRASRIFAASSSIFLRR